jgi:hypothetical protein
MRSIAADVVRVIRRVWPEILTGLLGICLILVASTASTPLRWLGLICGLAVAAAPWITDRSIPVAIGALLLGALLFASLTWSTVVTPVIAVLAIVSGVVAIRRRRHGVAHRGSDRTPGGSTSC